MSVAPNRGDRVRLTAGESTVVGTYMGRTPNYHLVSVDGGTTQGATQFHIFDWFAEAIEPTVLERVNALKPGAVIHNGRRGNAVLVKTVEGRWRFVYSDSKGTVETVVEIVAKMLESGRWKIMYEGHDVA